MRVISFLFNFKILFFVQMEIVQIYFAKYFFCVKKLRNFIYISIIILTFIVINKTSEYLNLVISRLLAFLHLFTNTMLLKRGILSLLNTHLFT